MGHHTPRQKSLWLSEAEQASLNLSSEEQQALVKGVVQRVKQRVFLTDILRMIVDGFGAILSGFFRIRPR